MGDSSVDEKDGFRLKPDVSDIVELKVEPVPLLAFNLVADLVEAAALCPPNMLAPLKMPPLFEEFERCILNRCIRPSQGRLALSRNRISILFTRRTSTSIFGICFKSLCF